MHDEDGITWAEHIAALDARDQRIAEFCEALAQRDTMLEARDDRIAAQAALLQRAEAALQLCVMSLVATNSSALESVAAVRDAIRAAREGQR